VDGFNVYLSYVITSLLEDLKIEAAPGKWGIYAGYTNRGVFNRIHVTEMAIKNLIPLVWS